MGRKSKAREKIINVAQRFFLQNSYESVSVDKICQAADVKKGSFYHFFPSKEDLLLAVIDANWEYMKQSIFYTAFDKSTPPLERIKKYFEMLHGLSIETQVQFGGAVACPIGVFAMEVRVIDKRVQQKVGETLTRFEKYFEAALRDAQEQGDVSPGLDVKLGAQMLVAYMQGMLLVSKSKDDAELIKKLSEGALKLIQ